MTAPGDVHAGANHNEHDIQFLHNMTGSLEGAAIHARAVITNGQHPDVMATARSILAMSTDASATVSRLATQLGHAAPGGSTSTSTSTGAGASGGHGNSGGNAGDGGGPRWSVLSGEERAVLTGTQVDTLPDSAFAYIEPGGSKDASGKTVPRSLRHFPIHDASHVRNALARAPQSPFGKKAMPAIMAAAKKFGVDTGMNSREPGATQFRSVPFEIQRTGNGLTLEGYAAVFDSPTHIAGFEGDFDETITRGAFARSLQQRTPVLMFEHGRHPLIGSMPLGVITRAQEDAKGLHIEARLSDNWLIQPVRDAVRDGGVNGMSFRFSVPEGGDSWEVRSGKSDLRTINQADVSELGPVVFPAYEPTTASIRSLVERLPDLTGRPDAWRAGGGDRTTSPTTDQLRLDTGALRTRGIIR